MHPLRLARRAIALAVLLPLAARAQRPDSAQRADSAAARDTAPDPRLLPREIAHEVLTLYNAPGTLRVNGSLDIVGGQEVTGDVAVLDGPLTIAGHVTGRVLAVNTDVLLKPGARIDGGLLVVGGTVEGRQGATIGGDLRIYRQPFYYHHEGERMVADRGLEDDRWWSRFQRQRRRRVWSDVTLASAHTYNRVEGLPILFGPTVERDFGWGRFELDALGIVRTAANFRWDADNLGHDLRSTLHLGGRGGILVGGRLYDVVQPVEEWQLGDAETGLASFFLHRDYRDYYNRHGGRLFAGFFAGRDADLTGGLSDERWGTRAQRDPFTLFRNDANWRPNPVMDEGAFHLANATLRVDTRNDRDDPWAGWYVVADLERGSGRYSYVAPTSPGVRDGVVAGERTTYTRGFLDLRRYNRIAPDAQVNLRLVLGGWLGGGELPLQRRFSLGGPGSLPGFDFRRVNGLNDYLQCSAGEGSEPSGRPAQCERLALAQVEYRGDLALHFGLFDDGVGGDDEGRRRHRMGWGFDGDATWVVFADAGRGWLVGTREGERQYPRDVMPPLGTFRTDVGAGLDFGSVGLYVAKSISDSRERANFILRVRRRF